MRPRTTSAELNAARRETLANPFRRKRRPNGEARYLNKREERMHPSGFDRAGNPTA
jgi:hypothetical protein